MDVIGVVGEFNPFHLGHYDHFIRSREQVGEVPVVCVMSGDFVQRGAPAAFDKHARARAAARCGADLVIELPLPWCLASAERFARGAVGLLDSLGFVTRLSFGSEAGDLAPLTALALALDEPGTIGRIREKLQEGISFAAAREQVLLELVGPEARLLEAPNNILGVEYLRALLRFSSSMTPMTTLRHLTRHDAYFHGPARSAAQLRSMMEAGEDIADYLPEPARDLPREQAAKGRGPVTMEDLEEALLSRLRMLSPADFAALPDATEGLDRRLYRACREEPSTEAILSAVKTRRYPLSRLRRMLLCAALGVRAGAGGERPGYARLLASTERGRALLRQVPEELPVITKPAAAHALFGEERAVFELTAAARDFYVIGYHTQAERRAGSDWRASPAAL